MRPTVWGEEAVLIACSVVTRFDVCTEVKEVCEICKVDICASSESTEKVKKEQNWHLVCKTCMVTLQDNEGAVVVGEVTPGKTPPWEAN